MMTMSSSNMLVDSVRYLTERASDVYETITFNTNGIYNKPAPDEWVAFMIGGIFSVIGFILWVYRYRKIVNSLEGEMTNSVRLRAMISSFIDCDDPIYTISKLAAQSFLFLGGLQYNYELVFSIMLGWFALESTSDSIRVLTAVSEVSSVKELVAASSNIRSKLRNVTTQLKPSNVYEDLSRTKIVVTMVFVTQCLLIAFVVADIFDTETHTCHDGTPGCPVVGTLGSWGFYVLGIFMASVFLLGPNTSFGQSEQNPAYWVQLLICAKKTGASLTWYDPVTDKTRSQQISPDDWRLWLRFFMTFCINGVGFHILVHALPIQVATQSSLTGVVFRAVGMLYLVDLDDTPGYTLTIVENEPEKVKPPVAEPQVSKPEEVSKPQEEQATDAGAGGTMSDSQLSAQAQAIIDSAKAQLDALAAGKTTNINNRINLTGALALAGGVGAGTAAVVTTSDNDGADVEVGRGQDGGDVGDVGAGDAGGDIGVEDGGGGGGGGGGGDEM